VGGLGVAQRRLAVADAIGAIAASGHGAPLPGMIGSQPMAKVVVTRQLPFPALERLAAAHEVETWPGALPPPPGELRALAADADGLLCLLTDRVDAALLDAAPRLRAI